MWFTLTLLLILALWKFVQQHFGPWHWDFITIAIPLYIIIAALFTKRYQVARQSPCREDQTTHVQ